MCTEHGGRFLHIALLILYITASNPSIITDLKSSLTSYLKNTLRRNGEEENTVLNQDRNEEESKEKSRFDVRHNDEELLEGILRNAKSTDDNKYYNGGGKALRSQNIFPNKNGNSVKHQIVEEIFRLDPVLNSFRKKNDLRRQNERDTSADDSGSSSRDLRDWKVEWKEYLINKKLEAMKSTDPRGDVVNMVAARPWGVPCGDPNQHDMPWGTCLLSAECEPEYRIYRGDFACGRTSFVCCAILDTNYDMNQAFDASFADSGLSSDSAEKKNADKNYSGNKKSKKKKNKERKQKEKAKHKKQIKKNIKNIIKEIKHILDKQYKNGTKQKKTKSKQLKKFIGGLKKKYKQDRQAVKHIQETEYVKIDAALMERLEEIRKLNEDFVANSTFRDIVLNKKISRSGAKMLVQAYPELVPFFTDNERRSGRSKDYLDYDVEYGMLYY